jgi:DNA polymerase-3 subunit delta
MDAQALKEALKTGNLKQVYLFCGEEAFLRLEYRRRVKTVLVNDADSMNYHYFEGNDASVSKVIELAETLPFLADRRVIIWENSGLFASAANDEDTAVKKKEAAQMAAGDRLASYLKTLPETTFILFVESKTDKRNKMYKAVAACGDVVEFPLQKPEELRLWVGALLNKAGKKVTERTAACLLEKVGNDMFNIHSEVEKLICYCGEREAVSEADIEAICTPLLKNRIFQMAEAVAGQRTDEALRLYHDMLALKVAPMWILSEFGKLYNSLLQIKELKGKGYGNDTIAARIGLPPHRAFVVGKNLSLAAKYGVADLRQALAACVATDEAIKSGNISDQVGVELLIVRGS